MILNHGKKISNIDKNVNNDNKDVNGIIKIDTYYQIKKT